MERETFIKAIRDVADWFEENDQVEVPDEVGFSVIAKNDVQFDVFGKQPGVSDRDYEDGRGWLSMTFAGEYPSNVEIAMHPPLPWPFRYADRKLARS